MPDTHDGTRASETLVELIRWLDSAGEDQPDATPSGAESSSYPTDVAPLRDALEDLVASEARYRELVSRCPLLLVALSADGRTLFANESAGALVGVPPADLTGTDWWRTRAPRDHHALVEALLHELKVEDVRDREVPLLAADGSRRHILWTSCNDYTPEGELATVYLFGVDQTDRFHAEDNRRRMEEADLARERVEMATLLKNEILASLSHELRTPLNAVLGYAQLLETGVHGPLNERQKESLQRLRRSHEHLVRLVAAVLRFARRDGARDRMKVRTVALEALLADLEALVAPAATRKGIRLHRRDASNAPRLHTDPAMLQQVLINLLINAITYTEPGGEVSLSWSPLREGLSLVVRDTGPGIAPRELSRIFEPFTQRVEPRPAKNGVGLGLAISRELVRAMGGDLRAYSVEGEGSTFEVQLPLEPPAAEDSVGLESG